MARLIGSLRASAPAVCELPGRTLTGLGGWWATGLDELMPQQPTHHEIAPPGWT